MDINLNALVYASEKLQAEIRKKEIAMKLFTKLLITMIAILLIGCSQTRQDSQNNNLAITGSGNLVSEELFLSNFDQVEAGLHFDLTFRQGKDSRVVLTSDDNFIEYIQVEQTGRGIRFGFKPGHAYDISGVTLQAEVTIPHLSKLELNSSSQAKIDGYRSQQPFEAELTGSSSLTGDLQLETAAINMYGSSNVKISGSAEKLDLQACGSSIVDLSDFESKDAALDVSCNSTIIVEVPGRLEVEASQYAQVYFTGNPVAKVLAVYEFASVQAR